MSLASLPMYDWPEVRGATDKLWAALRDAIRERGIDAPDTLDRDRKTDDVWVDPTLVLSQTCGMPWRLGLHSQAQLVGTPDYGLEGCPPGYYNSAIVVRATDPRETVEAFSDSTCAINGRNSQSGYGVWKGAPFASWLEVGSHRNSVEAVASGRADIAAIDAVSWRFSLQFQPQAAKLRVLDRTPPTPGLPFITAKTQDGAALFDAVTEALAVLDTETRTTLGIGGIVRIPDSAYRDAAT